MSIKILLEKMNNLNVCILTSSFPRDEQDPSAPFVYQLASALADKGVNITVLCPHDRGIAYAEYLGKLSITRFPYFYPTRYQRLCYGYGILPNLKKSVLARCQLPLFVVAEIVYCLKLVKKNNIDIVHAHWSLPQGLTAIICKRIAKTPCVTTLHGSDIHGLSSRGLKWLNAKVIKHSDVCTANSHETRRKAQQISKKDDIAVIPMGVDPLFLPVAGEGIGQRPGFQDGKKRILYAGRLIALKGVQYLIRALPAVLKAFPETQLVVVGSGPLKAELVDLSAHLDLSDAVIYIDKVSQEKLLALYRSADIFVLPSIVDKTGETEGLGVVLLEAMACGVPVVGSAVGGIPDIIKDGETGLLARQKAPESLAEKITRIFSDAALRQKLVENGYKMVADHFSWNRISQSFIDLYREVIDRCGTGGRQ